MNGETQLSEKLRALFAHKVGDISEQLQRPFRRFFGEAKGTLDDPEIADLASEFRFLIAALIASANPASQESNEYRALESFFVAFARKVLIRGGGIDDIVRFVQALQDTLIAALEAESGVQFTKSRSVLQFFSSLFIEMILVVFRTYLDQKDETIRSQQSILREAATPITEIWDGVLTLPIIGTLDSNRTMLIMDSLLNHIARQHTKVVVMDMTGVSSIDSQVSHYIVQMVRAIKLMGSDAVLTGIRPEIARALTMLNIDLEDICTRGSLSDGLKEAFRRLGIHVVTQNV